MRLRLFPSGLWSMWGGGASKSGVHNRLVLAHLDETSNQLKTIQELRLSNQEDAPMCLAVDRTRQVVMVSVNSEVEQVRERKNKTLRLFRYALPGEHCPSDDEWSVVLTDNRGGRSSSGTGRELQWITST